MSLRRRFWAVIRVLLGLFVCLNFYAISLRFMHVPTTILMMQRSLSGADIQREWVGLEDISPYVIDAVMAGEDSRFCEHEGLDWQAIEQAFEDNQEGGRRRGGSTITQQTAKNVIFWNGGGYIRKAGEAWFASLIDFTWGKSRVMEVYLNVAEWGDGIFGIEAAAQARFGKSAKDLSPQEAALLAAVLPSPNKWRLNPPSEFVQKRSGILRQRMKIIQNSGYAACMSGLAPRKVVLPKEPKDEALQSEVTLEEVLDAAEDSLKNEETDLPDIEPTPRPNEIPPIDPSTIPHEPDAIPPFPVPEIPEDMPQEAPAETPAPDSPMPDEF